MNYKETGYIQYLQQKKKISENTKAAYQRDLDKMCAYLEAQDIEAWSDVSFAALNSYILYMERQGLSNATVSRNVAVIKGFFRYLFQQRSIDENSAELLESPKVVRREPKKASEEDVKKILFILRGDTPKLLRDKAMLEVFCSAGFMVEELIGLRLEDINMDMGYVRGRQNVYPVSGKALISLELYLTRARTQLLKGEETDILFPNVRGRQMTRQGFWKMVQKYAAKAGVEGEITPSMMRRSGT